ncbi:MAG: prephenate dehydrogenase/arogenate dehydrogenase family protein [Calditrichaeota bacterium]|nr:prephenate dehydrogenase/arogenate dehydrogenase family protein [Calditrichota bacterium]
MLRNSIAHDEDTLTLPEMEQAHRGEFENIAIIGVGMIGGSIGLTLRQSGFRGQITGLDKKDVLDQALARGAIDRAVGDLAEAVPSADLVVLATPVLETCALLPTILRTVRLGVLVTDTGGTKAEICSLAARTKEARGIFIGGHPLTGTMRQGIANAHPELFASVYYVLTPLKKRAPHLLESLKWWVHRLGALPLVLDPGEHDRLMAATSHLPLLLSLTLTEWMADLACASADLYKLAHGDFREMTRRLDCAFATWEGLLKTNREEIRKAIANFRKALAHCETRLDENHLAESFRQAHSFRDQVVRQHVGPWDTRCELIVTAPDRPGTFARITGLLAEHQISIRELRVLYVRETFGGNLSLELASPVQAATAMNLLKREGFDVRLKE